MGLFRKKAPETRATEDDFEADLLTAIYGDEVVTRKIAMSIPSVAACVNRISDTVASLDVRLYEKDGDSVTEIEDIRTERLNGKTGDTLTGYQLKRAMVVDMLLGKGGYAYIQKVSGIVRGLFYVPCNKISFRHSEDPIFKAYKIMIDGKTYEDYKFIKLLRNSENGYSGKSIIADSDLLFQIVAAEQEFEKSYSKRGGMKKGYMQTQSRVDAEAKRKLKEAFSQMYSNNSDSIVVLNEGMTFKEAAATSQELQLNENKVTNNEDICKIFGVPPKIISGGATPEDKRLYYEGCIYPILMRFATALNDALLNPFDDDERRMFFAFDDTMLTKADLETRYRSYAIGLKNGFLQLDEIREKENLPAFGLDFVKLGLQDVLLYPESGEIYTPNMGVFANLKDKTVITENNGGTNDESKISE